jgi:hypothetical protein
MPMTLQEIFDTVSVHLIKQGRRSAGGDISHFSDCRYHFDGGLMCAVGALIKAEHYNPMIEGFEAEHENVMYALYRSGVVEKDVLKEQMTEEDEMRMELLKQLQFVHDYKPPKDWGKSLIEEANRFELDLKNFDAFLSRYNVWNNMLHDPSYSILDESLILETIKYL